MALPTAGTEGDVPAPRQPGDSGSCPPAPSRSAVVPLALALACGFAVAGFNAGGSLHRLSATDDGPPSALALLEKAVRIGALFGVLVGALAGFSRVAAAKGNDTDLRAFLTARAGLSLAVGCLTGASLCAAAAVVYWAGWLLLSGPAQVPSEGAARFAGAVALALVSLATTWVVVRWVLPWLTANVNDRVA